MVFQKLIRKFQQKHFQKQLNFYQKQSRNLNAEKIKKVAVLVEESQIFKSRIILILEEILDLKYGTVEVLIFRSYQKKQPYSENEITKRDFGWSGSLKLNKLHEFVKNEYDLLINYGFEDNLYWKIITLYSQSKFKVGFSSADSGLYDLSISDKERNLNILNTEMVKYLNILNKL